MDYEAQLARVMSGMAIEIEAAGYNEKVSKVALDESPEMLQRIDTLNTALDKRFIELYRKGDKTYDWIEFCAESVVPVFWSYLDVINRHK